MRLWTGRLACALALSLGAAIGLASAAWAQAEWTDEDFQQTGFYLAGMAVYGVPTEQSDIESAIENDFAARGASVDGSFGASGRIGYRFHPRFGFESQFEWLRAIEVESREISGGAKRTDDITLMTVTGNAKGYLLTGRVQPYGVLGAGWMHSTLNPSGSGTATRDDGFLLRIGGGADLYANPNVGLTLEAAYLLTPGGATEDFDYVSIGAGILLRFYGN